MRRTIIAVVLVVVLLLLWLALPPKEESYQPPPVDIVYTWVDGSDLQFQEEKDIWASAYGASTESTHRKRFSDAEELRYSLRSIDRFFPSYRKVYLVVKDGQLPPYIKPHPKLEVVPHSAIIDPEYLPTFNSLCIELFLHRIPGLSEHYLYFNDDVFLLRDMTFDTFYEPDGTPRTAFDDECMNDTCDVDWALSRTQSYSIPALCSWNMALLQYLGLPYSRGFNRHICAPCRRSWDAEIEALLKKPLPDGRVPWEMTASSKFRRPDSAALNSIIRPMYYTSKGAMQHDFEDALLHLSEEKAPRDALRSSFETKGILCVNEIPSDREALFAEEMSALLPEPSRFEK